MEIKLHLNQVSLDETYKDIEFVSPLLTQISWSNHLGILSATKSMEEREEEEFVKRLRQEIEPIYLENVIKELNLNVGF